MLQIQQWKKLLMILQEADEAEAEDVAAEDATEETEEDLGPLYSIEAAVAPDVAGTTWHFVGRYA